MNVQTTHSQSLPRHLPHGPRPEPKPKPEPEVSQGDGATGPTE